ncbi:hypothetical protein [Rhizobium leguminosarum]|uniref:hypothetical protein n=1 Tax=Rhizobium leguminosarum TaxID=384 RepID=UPI000B92D235|nr:hypothetical protein [Rhizobium leguminosarum]ASS55902.1 hypothetical protein CHR56_15755 [Rhizobium leguminosarum bv. viciae]
MATKGARGVRLNPTHDDRTRAKIKTSQIINRLEKLVNGEIEMNAQQVTAAGILLKKTLPDLSAVTMDGKITLTHEDALNELD